MLKRGKLPLNLNGTDTLIGEGTTIEGKITSKAGLRIEGQVKGDIDCSGDVTIGENSKIHSNLSARNIVIAGIVNGSITTKEMLSITATGKVYGDITVSSLQIVEGGIFQGTSRMETRSLIERHQEKETDNKPQPAKIEKISAVK